MGENGGGHRREEFLAVAQKTVSMKGPARAASIGALVGALATLPGLGAGTLWDNSETAYGEVAREILLAHDWIVMHLNGHPWFVQPPLYFWIAAIFARILGVSAFALRLPSALATVSMGAVIAYAIARRSGERAGIFAGIVLSTSLMQAIIGRLAIMDALLDLFVTIAIFEWFAGMQNGEDRPYILGAVALGLGFLAKGPVAPVIALLVIVPYYLWGRRYERLHVPSRRAWALGVAAFIAIVVPWFVGLAMRTSLHSIAQLIGHYTLGRYTSVIENQSGPVWYYVPVLILGFFPWIAFLVPAIAYGVDLVRKDSLWRLGFVWMIAPLLFFSFAETKLPNYIALEVPGLAMITGLYFDAVSRKGASRSAIAASAVVPVTIGMLAIAIRIFTLDNRLTTAVSAAVPALLGAAVAIFLGSLVCTVLLARRLVAAAPYALAVAMLAALDVLAVAVLPHAEAFKPIPTLAAAIERGRRPGDVVAIANVSGSNALVFYTQPGVIIARRPRAVVCDARRAWLIVPRSATPLDPPCRRSHRVVATAAKAALYLYEPIGSR
jgi:4-amino-4-deoxy-L-arabinose transferase-like glycosyltransferase